jgi:hypothetical protein
MKSSALLTLAVFAVGTLANGFISCADHDYDVGDYTVPGHYIEYQWDVNDQYYLRCDEVATDCDQLPGKSSRESENCQMMVQGTPSGTQSAEFWITPDTCLNILSGGNHMWCCNDNGRDDGSTYSCVTSGWGPM